MLRAAAPGRSARSPVFGLLTGTTQPPRSMGGSAWLTYWVRVDIPWWSPGLRDRAAMLTWEPGTPVAGRGPRLIDADLVQLQSLLGPGGAPAQVGVVERIAKKREWERVASYAAHNAHDFSRSGRVSSRPPWLTSTSVLARPTPATPSRRNFCATGAEVRPRRASR